VLRCVADGLLLCVGSPVCFLLISFPPFLPLIPTCTARSPPATFIAAPNTKHSSEILLHLLLLLERGPNSSALQRSAQQLHDSLAAEVLTLLVLHVHVASPDPNEGGSERRETLPAQT